MLSLGGLEMTKKCPFCNQIITEEQRETDQSQGFICGACGKEQLETVPEREFAAKEGRPEGE